MNRFFNIYFILTLFSFMFLSCQKKSTDLLPTETQVEFSFSEGSLKSSNALALSYVVVTIEDLQGNIVKNAEKIELYNMNGSYISKPVNLMTGDYKLSGFIVLDAANNVVYATPIAGSAKAYLVDKPLPLTFKAQKDVVAKLNPEVLSTHQCHPQDFGYTTFGFQIAETFDFLISTLIYNDAIKNFELTSASISISSNSKIIYSGSLEAKTTLISLPQKYSSYTITISKTGYKTYNKTITNTEKDPVMVILSKNDFIPGLIAYYPFNNNANDESGNGYNGSIQGVSIASDMVGYANSAYSFDGNSSSIELGQAFDLKEGTYSMWINARAFPVWNYPSSETMSTLFGTDNPNLQYGSFSLNVTNKNSVNELYIVVGSIGGGCEFETPLVINTWNHVVLTKDLNNAKVYLNGQLLSTKNIAFAVSIAGNRNAILGTTRLKNGRFFDGLMDEIRIYNRVLSDTEIAILYLNK